MYLLKVTQFVIYLSAFFLINFIKDKRKKGHSQGEGQGEESEECDEEEVIIPFGFKNDKQSKE